MPGANEHTSEDLPFAGGERDESPNEPALAEQNRNVSALGSACFRLVPVAAVNDPHRHSPPPGPSTRAVPLIKYMVSRVIVPNYCRPEIDDGPWYIVFQGTRVGIFNHPDDVDRVCQGATAEYMQQFENEDDARRAFRSAWAGNRVREVHERTVGNFGEILRNPESVSATLTDTEMSPSLSLYPNTAVGSVAVHSSSSTHRRDEERDELRSESSIELLSSESTEL